MNSNILFQLVFSHCLCFIASLLIFGLMWSRREFPMQQTPLVFFVLNADVAGHAGLFRSLLLRVYVPTAALYGGIALAFFWGRKTCAVAGVSLAFFDFWFSRLSDVYLIAVGVVTIVKLKAWNYPYLFYQTIKKPVRSQFYEEHYANPHTTRITAPEKKRNLVMIFMESMESSFAAVEEGGVFSENIIPRLTRLASENINFSNSALLGGGENLVGTSWTVAGIISKMAGLPYFSPFAKGRGGKTVCLANASTLTDILVENGWNCVFSFGSEKRFENRDAFLESHGVEVHDIAWYRERGFIPADYQIFWGFEDARLFEFAKTELSALAKKDAPFFYGMLTVDTHFPDGWHCPDCPDMYKRQIMNVLRCADTRVSDFVSWMRSEPWWENTTVIIVGDHNYLNAPKNNFIRDESPLSDNEKRRRWLDIIINPRLAENLSVPQSAYKNRRFSPYDMFPTAIESLGFSIEGRALAFGRSLFSGEPTLLEQFGADVVNRELMRRTAQYDALKSPKR